MEAMTHSPAQIAQDFITSIEGVPSLSISRPGTYSRDDWGATCYWPNGDVVRDIGCYGTGDSLEGAIADMLAKVEKAKSQVSVLKTAAECKAAVLNLIREHDAAPASFRDAVDALPVKR